MGTSREVVFDRVDKGRTLSLVVARTYLGLACWFRQTLLEAVAVRVDTGKNPWYGGMRISPAKGSGFTVMV